MNRIGEIALEKTAEKNVTCKRGFENVYYKWYVPSFCAVPGREPLAAEPGLDPALEPAGDPALEPAGVPALEPVGDPALDPTWLETLMEPAGDAGFGVVGLDPLADPPGKHAHKFIIIVIFLD